jgi:hypothetical protein
LQDIRRLMYSKHKFGADAMLETNSQPSRDPETEP